MAVVMAVSRSNRFLNWSLCFFFRVSQDQAPEAGEGEDVDLCKDKKSSQDKVTESKDEGDTLHEVEDNNQTVLYYQENALRGEMKGNNLGPLIFM